MLRSCRMGNEDDRSNLGTDLCFAGDRLLTIAQVKQRPQIPHETVYRLMRQGTLRSTKIGRARRVKQSVLDAYIRSLPDV